MENDKKPLEAAQQPETAIQPTEIPEQAGLVPAAVAPGGLTMWTDAKLMNLAFKQASMLSRSGLVPDQYKQSPENCLIAIDIGNRLGLSPMMVMQNLYIVKGKPAWSGSFCSAIVNGSARFSPLEFQFTGAAGSDDWGCRAIATRKSTGALCESEWVTIRMAKAEGWLSKGGSKWQTMPKQMMMYRAASFFAKAHCPDLLFGVPTREEVNDTFGYQEEGQRKTVVLGGGDK